MSDTPELSIIIASHNRVGVIRDTLERIAACGLDAHAYETIIVDNASTDGTAAALNGRDDVTVIRLEQNLGSCAKAIAVDAARGPLLLFLDDDSYPRPGCLARMLERFDADPELGAAAFTVHLPDGSQECSALPHVFVGCGVGLRTSAVRQVGGLDATFFMQAEEYDLSFRLLRGGWHVEVLADLQVEHLKTPRARRSERTTYYDARNNLRVVARYLPDEYAEIYTADWLQRYGWMAENAGHLPAFRRGVAAGRLQAVIERRTGLDTQLTPPLLERIFRWRWIERRMRDLAAIGVRRIVLADLGKNIYAYLRGARAAGLEIACVLDDAFASPERFYRELPIVTTAAALQNGADAFVVSNTSYVHADRRRRDLGACTSRPIYSWFAPPTSETIPAQRDLVHGACATDR